MSLCSSGYPGTHIQHCLATNWEIKNNWDFWESLFPKSKFPRVCMHVSVCMCAGTEPRVLTRSKHMLHCRATCECPFRTFEANSETEFGLAVAAHPFPFLSACDGIWSRTIAQPLW